MTDEPIRVAKSIPYKIYQSVKDPEARKALQRNFTVTLDGVKKDNFLREREELAVNAEKAAHQQRIEDTRAALEEIDRRAARSLRALLLDGNDSHARDKLAALEAEAQPVRDALQALVDAQNGDKKQEGEIRPQ